MNRRPVPFLEKMVRASAVLTIGTVLVIVGYILLKGIPYLRPSMFSWEYTSSNVSMLPAIVNTMFMLVLSLAIVLPAAFPGILSGAILASGRIFGESAALIFTAGKLAQAAGSLNDSARTMAVHLYALSQEGLYINETYASAAVLIAIVLLMNGLAAWLAHKTQERSNHG
ncbi:hypothetical protein AAK706_10865 [Erysipelotrichaceae bacterium 66-17]